MKAGNYSLWPVFDLLNNLQHIPEGLVYANNSQSSWILRRSIRFHFQIKYIRSGGLLPKTVRVCVTAAEFYARLQVLVTAVGTREEVRAGREIRIQAIVL